MNPTNFIKQYMLQGLTPKGILQKMNIQNPILNNVIQKELKTLLEIFVNNED